MPSSSSNRCFDSSHIAISQETKQNLSKILRDNETYDEAIARMIDAYDQLPTWS